MTRSHILFLTSWYPTKKSPFAGDFVQRHAKAAALLNDITVLHAERNDKQKESYEISVIKDSITEIRVHYKGSFFKPFNFFKRLAALYKGHKLTGNYDLIHLNVTYPAGIFALFLKKFKHKKYVITEHWTGFRKEQFEKINFVERFLIKQIVKNSDIILPVSQDLGESMLRISPKTKMEIIPNVIDTKVFTLNKNPIKNPIKKFLHLSSLKDEHKNISGMLNVAKKLLDEGYQFEFHFGGTGSSELIESFNNQHHLENSIFYFPSLAYEEVPEKMWEFDSFVLFSNYENQPCVQGESFACGLPFIGTDVGGIKEFLPENFGFLIEKGNEKALYEAMKKVLNNHSFASKKEMNHYAVNLFSRKVIAKRFDDIYQMILKNEQIK